jgi:hypothetical protein
MSDELAALDPAFFDEIEDLKFALKRTNSLIARYDEAVCEAAFRLGCDVVELRPRPL